MGGSEQQREAGFDESAEDLLENAPCGYLSAAPDGTLVRVNATFLRWTGYRRDQLVGVKRFQDLLTVGGRIYHETHYAPMLQMQGTVREIAVEIVGSNGDRLPVLVNSVLVRDSQGAPRLVRTTVFDATERKLYERELMAARDRERVARERIERLQRITAAMASAPDAQAIASAVTGELVAALGAERAGVAVRDPETEELRILAGHGEVNTSHLGTDAEFDEGEDAQGGAAVRLPLGAVGRLWLEFDASRRFEPEERLFLMACAVQTDLALERSRRHQETRDVAHSLQRSLLAGALPRDSRFEVATLYHAAVEHIEVGGDWHDAFRLAGRRVGIVVGDVVGRGLVAASAMGQLRSAVRALAGADLAPAAVLSHLDTFVEQVDAARYATLAYADVDPDTGSVAFASAGHLPPVMLDPGSAPRLFTDGLSPPLGVTTPGLVRSQTAFSLAPNAGFLLYTDGLVERRTEPIDAGLERLLAAVRASPGRSPAQLIETLHEALLEQGSVSDDVCLLSFRLSGRGPGEQPARARRTREGTRRKQPMHAGANPTSSAT
jgi:PAS domain S-box-containing protein